MSEAITNPFAKRCYTMSESHLSGYRLIVGFERLEDAQEAHIFVANAGRETSQPAPAPQPAPAVSKATTKATLMAEHRDYIDGYAAGLADGRRIAPQPAAPVVSDEQIRKTVESIRDPDTVPAFHNGYYTLTPDELRLAILALRPAAEPMTPLTDSEMEKGREQIFSTNNPYCPCDRKTFRKVAQWVEWHHKIGITATAEGGA